jgi:hypothetical protein
LDEDLVCGSIQASLAKLQAEQLEAVRIPAQGFAARGLGYHEPSSELQERGPTFGGGRRGCEASGHDAVKLAPEFGPPGDLRSFADNLHPVGQPQSPDGIA